MAAVRVYTKELQIVITTKWHKLNKKLNFKGQKKKKKLNKQNKMYVFDFKLQKIFLSVQLNAFLIPIMFN